MQSDFPEATKLEKPQVGTLVDRPAKPAAHSQSRASIWVSQLWRPAHSDFQMIAVPANIWVKPYQRPLEWVTQPILSQVPNF